MPKKLDDINRAINLVFDKKIDQIILSKLNLVSESISSFAGNDLFNIFRYNLNPQYFTRSGDTYNVEECVYAYVIEAARFTLRSIREDIEVIQSNRLSAIGYSTHLFVENSQIIESMIINLLNKSIEKIKSKFEHFSVEQIKLIVFYNIYPSLVRERDLEFVNSIDEEAVFTIFDFIGEENIDAIDNQINAMKGKFERLFYLAENTEGGITFAPPVLPRTESIDSSDSDETVTSIIIGECGDVGSA